MFDTHPHREPHSNHFIGENHKTFRCPPYAKYQRKALHDFKCSFILF